MKKTVILFHLCFVFTLVNAQKKQNVYFFKSNGKEVNKKDSADFVRIILEPDSGETNFILQEYFVNGKRKTLGKISSFDPRLIYEGVVLRFDTSGKRKEITSYEKGMPIGTSYHYFSNGVLHKQIEYLPYSPLLTSSNSPVLSSGGSVYNPNSKMMHFADSLGVVHVKDGNGDVKIIEIIGKAEQVEEGKYVDGVKHGVWKGNVVNSGASFVETYEKGKLLGGESIKDGVKYAYTDLGQPPSFKGGANKFYQYLGYSIKYPSDAVRNRISGVVILEFTVEKDGRTTEIIVKKSVFPSLDEEAKRVIMQSTRWVPGTMRGIPVRVKYTIPIRFTMP